MSDQGIRQLESTTPSWRRVGGRDERKPTSWRRVATSNTATWVYRLVGVALFLMMWELIVRAELMNPVFLPSPTQVAETLVELVRTGELWPHVLETLKATFVGFALGTLVGASAGFLIGLSPLVTAVLSPFITMMNSTPRIALAPLFVVWFGIGITSRIVLVFSLVVFIVLTNTIAGTQSVEKDHLTLARLLSASKAHIIFKIALPSVLPWILAAMRLSFAYALAGAVVGEMFLGQRGLGYLIIAGSGLFNISQIFAALVVTVAIAFVADSLLASAERRILRWRT